MPLFSPYFNFRWRTSGEFNNHMSLYCSLSEILSFCSVPAFLSSKLHLMPVKTALFSTWTTKTGKSCFFQIATGRLPSVEAPFPALLSFVFHLCANTKTISSDGSTSLFNSINRALHQERWQLVATVSMPAQSLTSQLGQLVEGGTISMLWRPQQTDDKLFQQKVKAT